MKQLLLQLIDQKISEISKVEWVKAFDIKIKQTMSYRLLKELREEVEKCEV